MSINRNRQKLTWTMNFWRDLKQHDYSPKHRLNPKHNDRSRDRNRR